MNSVKLTVPSLPEYMGVVRLTASSLATLIGFDIEAIEDIRVCVSEACNNAMQYNPEVFLQFEVADDCLSIDVKGFQDPEDEQNRMGLLIMESLMDVVQATTAGIHLEVHKETL